MKTTEQVIEDLAGILRSFPDREYLGEIHSRTRFFDDLGFASIDAVVLAEKIQEYYRQEFPFREFLDELRKHEDIDIRIGELAAFVRRHLKSGLLELNTD